MMWARLSLRITAGCLLSCLLLVVPLRLNAEASVGRQDLSCSGTEAQYIDAGDVAILKRAELHGNRFTAWIRYGVAEDALKRHSESNLSNAWALGYRLDDAPVMSVKLFAGSAEMTVALGFTHLKPMRHRIVIGLINYSGELTQENAYCFSSPGDFTFIRREFHSFQ